jgi:transcriptional regulator with XRE-family HTH domain
MSDTLETIPDRCTLTRFAHLAGIARSTVSEWRSGDHRFPKPGADGRFATILMVAFLERRDLARATTDEIRSERKAGADRLDAEIERGTFGTGAMATRCRKLARAMRTGDPETHRRQRIAEIERQFAEATA